MKITNVWDVPTLAGSEARDTADLEVCTTTATEVGLETGRMLLTPTFSPARMFNFLLNMRPILVRKENPQSVPLDPLTPLDKYFQKSDFFAPKRPPETKNRVRNKGL